MKRGPCARPVSPKKWFKVAVEVQDGAARVYIDGELVVTATPHFDVIGNGGISVARRYSNVVRFRHFMMSEIKD